jgi:hypothetical protein
MCLRELGLMMKMNYFSRSSEKKDLEVGLRLPSISIIEKGSSAERDGIIISILKSKKINGLMKKIIF